MTLNKNDSREGFGDIDVLGGAKASVAAAAFSIAGDVDEWVNTDNVEIASVVLTFTPSADTTDGDTIKLYASKNLVDGIKNENAPSTTNKSKLLATFIIGVSALEQTVTAEVQLDNCLSGQRYNFAIENLLTLVSINLGWSLTVIPKSKGDSA